MLVHGTGVYIYVYLCFIFIVTATISTRIVMAVFNVTLRWNLAKTLVYPDTYEPYLSNIPTEVFFCHFMQSLNCIHVKRG